MTGETTNFGTSFFYNQPNKVILGSAYLFDEWNNDGEIQTLTGERFLVRNINLNISYLIKNFTLPQFLFDIRTKLRGMKNSYSYFYLSLIHI